MKHRMTLIASLLLVAALLLAACPAPAAPAAPAAEAPAAEAPAEEAAAEEAAEAPAEEAAEGEAAADLSDIQLATVVKISGINWFDRMEEGVNQFAADTGISATQYGPPQADGALQVQIIEDLIAQQVDGLCVVPMSPEILDPVLKKAMDAGIKVVTHEASNQVSIDADIEAFDNAGYGRHLMDALAERMGEEGEYAVFVGSLTSKTHNEWVDAAIAHQQENYPNMTLVGDKNESFDDTAVAYEKAKELLRAYPNIRGFQGSASTDVPGIGQAVEEAGLEDQIAVVGTSLPSTSRDLLETGAIDMISFWDPALAGYVCNQMLVTLIEGGELAAGTDYGQVGYESVTQDGKVFYGQAWVDVTAENAGDYDF